MDHPMERPTRRKGQIEHDLTEEFTTAKELVRAYEAQAFRLGGQLTDFHVDRLNAARAERGRLARIIRRLGRRERV